MTHSETPSSDSDSAPYSSYSSSPPIPPLVSIIVPAFNAAPWIGETLCSALAQTWPHTEIVVVDDGSTDDTLSLARAFASDRVTVLSQPNRGAAAARNAGLATSRGEYIQFLDADDLLAPDKLARQLPLLQPLGPSVLSSAAWARFERDPASAAFTPQPNWRDLTGVEFLQLHFETLCMMHPAAWLAPRALLDRAGPWDESLSLNDDGEYFARVMLAADRIVFCESARSYYRSNLSASLSARKDPRSLASLFRSIDLTVGNLLHADHSPRSRAAAAYAWKWASFELHPGTPDLSVLAEKNSLALGGSSRPFPAGGRFQLLSRLLGWRLAKRLCL